MISESDVALASAAHERDLRSQVIDLRHVFDDQQHPVLFSAVHMNEEGAGVLAKALIDAVLTKP